MPLSSKLTKSHFSYIFNQPGRTPNGTAFYSSTIRFVTHTDTMNFSELMHLLDGLGIELDNIIIDPSLTDSDVHPSFKLTKPLVRFARNINCELSVEKSSDSNQLRLAIELKKTSRDLHDHHAEDGLFTRLKSLFVSVQGSDHGLSEIEQSLKDNTQMRAYLNINPDFESFSDLGKSLKDIHGGLPKDTSDNWQFVEGYSAPSTVDVEDVSARPASPSLQRRGTVVGFWPHELGLPATLTRRATMIARVPAAAEASVARETMVARTPAVPLVRRDTMVARRITVTTPAPSSSRANTVVARAPQHISHK